MYSVKSISSHTLILFALIQMSGCATLNESECQSANWEIIGLEDGSKGRNTSYIGEHREACSEYRIAPDLTSYIKGHKQGLKQFCTQQNGYQQGVKGATNNQVCTGSSVRDFNRGHQDGLRIYRASKEILGLESEIDSRHHRLEDIEKQKRAMEEELVRNGTKEYRRRELLEEIKSLERESEATYIEIDNMRISLARLKDIYQRMIRN
ncbi:MAG: DUF2799 domain-containing protein [Kangiellaceae bacterium]|nr:DUF2799 domain-containing protein [Kangiellaceae bacterium]